MAETKPVPVFLLCYYLVNIGVTAQAHVATGHAVGTSLTYASGDVACNAVLGALFDFLFATLCRFRTKTRADFVRAVQAQKDAVRAPVTELTSLQAGQDAVDLATSELTSTVLKTRTDATGGTIEGILSIFAVAFWENQNATKGE